MGNKKQTPGVIMDRRKELGKRSEDIGADWLASKGMHIVERNYRCRLGEIDLIGRHDDMLVFVEIRSRSSADRGTPAESVNYTKIQKLRRLATWYLSSNKGSGMDEVACRFDVLGILHQGDAEPVQIEWIQNAF